ncbi:MAG TPA: hypothetical protein VF698_06420, partial [Thermoanaerobaculia bacterium]
MGRRSIRREACLVVLVALLAVQCHRPEKKAEPTSKAVYEEIYAAIQARESDLARRRLAEARKQFAGRSDEWIWGFEVLEAYVTECDSEKLLETLTPGQYENSVPNIERLALLAGARRSPQLYNDALRIAAAHHPEKQPLVLLTRAQRDGTNSESDIENALRIARQYHDTYNVVGATALLGVRDCNEKRFADCLERLESARDAWPANPRRYLFETNLSWAYLALGDSVTAEQIAGKALRTAKQKDDREAALALLNQLGDIATRRGDYTRAAAYFNEAANAGDEIVDKRRALANAAATAVALGQIDDAERFNALALEAKRKEGETESVLISLIVDARIRAARRQYAGAEKVLREVIASTKDPKTRWEAHGRLAEMYAAAGRNADAAR